MYLTGGSLLESLSDLKSVKTNRVDWNKGKVAKRFKVLTNVSLLL